MDSVEQLQKEIARLQAVEISQEMELAAKDADIREIIIFIKKTLTALGVKDMRDVDHIGKTIMKGIPGLATDSIIRPHVVQRKFEHFKGSTALFAKYEHIFYEEDQKLLPGSEIKKLNP